MIDAQALRSTLDAIGLMEWSDALESAAAQRISSAGHGDYSRWAAAVAAIAAGPLSQQELRQQLLELSPWRKGPFHVGGISIDTEWRSDLKWARLAKAVAPLAGRSVLDVGCGNGYYALQMHKAGAKAVIGVDPTLLFVMQFLAINVFEQADSVFVLPLRLHELPLPAGKFDTTFSMGVLYHQRSPVDHLRQLRQTLRAGGQLVLETIYLPGDAAFARTPPDRYARMRNIWLLPSIAELSTWLARCGFRDIQVIDTSITTVDEQRSTEWMTFESLAEALDPRDPMKTVEGWPAPHRLVMTATAP